ncbi:serine/threonine-protein kinase GA29083-like [Teleopsis dalmanni]|uniref:serine/threonine-protein kinase GA29083-like n=1 Tax=Teleopsis dalmanni TaxID=139649 RepID=UPI0018CF199E|nr:serine/threonine-protein kinase GA29083-like [Teleopsis dalmanni]
MQKDHFNYDVPDKNPESICATNIPVTSTTRRSDFIHSGLKNEFAKIFENLGIKFNAATLSKQRSRMESTNKGLFWNKSYMLRKQIFNIPTAARAKRIRFIRNGDILTSGIVIPVSKKKYRSFESLLDDITRMFRQMYHLTRGISAICTLNGDLITDLDKLEKGKSYACCYQNEHFKKVQYKVLEVPAVQGKKKKEVNYISKFNKMLQISKYPKVVNKNTNDVEDQDIIPRTLMLIKDGVPPRNIKPLLLNKDNALHFEQAVKTISDLFSFDSTQLPNIYSPSGEPVLKLSQLFADDYIFFVFDAKTEPIPNKFSLHPHERVYIMTNGQIDSAIKDVHKNVSAEKLMDDSKLRLCIAAAKFPVQIREHYNFGEVIGDGNYSIVIKMFNRYNLNQMALKIIDKRKYQNLSYFHDEVRIMRKLKHRHIVTMLMSFDRCENMYIGFEYLRDGDLFDIIKRAKKFSEEQSRLIIEQLASALIYMHSKSIIHRDIKPENLLVRLDETHFISFIKLSDFGFAIEALEPIYDICGTPAYMAPETVKRCGYYVEVDVWATGVLLYLLLSGYFPIDLHETEYDSEICYNLIEQGKYNFDHKCWKSVSKGARNLIASMMEVNVSLRLTGAGILSHYWIMNKNQ